MKKAAFFIIILICFGTSLPAQITFQKTWGGTGIDYAYDIHKASSGGYFIGAVSNSLVNPVTNSYVVRINNTGDTLWTAIYAASSDSSDAQYINDICPTTDGGCIAVGGKSVSGNTNVGGNIVRFDANGNVLWSKYCSYGEDPYPVIQSADGNFIVGGYVTGIGAGGEDACLMKLNSNGDTLWSKTYGGSGDDWFYHIVQTNDGGYLATGFTTSFGQGNRDVYVVKTDANGNLQWSKAYGTSNYENAFGHSLEKTQDGGYIICGQGDNGAQSNSGWFLMKIDNAGILSWAKYYSGTYAHAVKETPDKGFVVAGTSGTGMQLIKTDSLGNLQWSKGYPGRKGLILELADDGGYITGGQTTSTGGYNSSYDIQLIKTDANGNSGCNESSPAVTVSTAPFVTVTAATQVAAGANTISYTLVLARGGILTTQCSAVETSISSFSPSSGCSAVTSVIVTGTQFTGATAVKFGGTNALNFTINSATQITATVGSGTNGSITVTTGNGIASSASTFTVGNIWNGSTNNSWSTASNWGCAIVPTSTDNVTIPNSVNQPVIGSAVNATTNNLSINSSAALTVNGVLNVNGQVVNNGTLTVTPGAGIINSSSISNVTIQQNIIAQRGWRMFANPFSTSQTFSTVAANNGIDIQTNASGNAAGIADNRIFSNISNTWSDGGTTVAANTAYGLFIRGLHNEVTGFSYSGGPTAFTYNISGTLNGATTSVTPSNTANFLLVGNPYAAPVTSKALTGQTAGTNYYIYTISQSGTQSGQRTTAGSWVAASSNSNTSNTIPVLGVIAYQPASTASFSITPSDINTSGTVQTGLFGVQSSVQQIELQVEQNGDFKDKLFVRLDANATASGKERTDLLKFYNDNVNVYTIGTTDNSRMAIDARNVLNNIPLGISGLAGEYNFKLNSNNLPEGTIVYLKDKLLNTQTALNIVDTYPFTISSDTATMGEKRFELLFSSKKTVVTADVNGSLTANVLGNITSGNLIAVQIAGATTPVTIAIKDMNAKALGIMNASNGIQYVHVGNTGKGMMLLQISDGKSTIIKKVMKL